MSATGGAAQAPAARAAELSDALATVERRLAAAAAAVGRRRAEVTLVAVSKNHPVADVAVLQRLGVTDFGEARAQEGAAKAAALAATWHFLGRLQRNKAAGVARWADLVHSLDRAELLDPLGRAAQARGRDLEVLLQISLDADPQRGGVLPERLAELADATAATPGLVLGGVMAVAPVTGEAARHFALLAECAQRVAAAYPAARVISAGMSSDLEAAVAAGATHVRLGTALFGRRAPGAR